MLLGGNLVKPEMANGEKSEKKMGLNEVISESG
jgi:hypothetical protein